MTRWISPDDDREPLILASILDPRFKLQLCVFDIVHYSSKRTLLKSYPSYISDMQDAATVKPTTSPYPKKKWLFDFMDNATAIPHVNTGTEEAEIQDYLWTPYSPVGSDALQYWRKIAIIYLGIR